MEVYGKCPKCKMKALLEDWNDETESAYPEDNIEYLTEDGEYSGDCDYLCPNCSEFSDDNTIVIIKE